MAKYEVTFESSIVRRVRADKCDSQKLRMSTKQNSHTKFGVRRASPDDGPAILRCRSAAFEPYRTQYTVAGYEDTVLTAETVQQRMRNMVVLVACNEFGVIIGTVGGNASGKEGHIRGMAVAPSSQGTPVGHRLLETIERELLAAGCSRVTLDTTAPLIRAMRFYERHGYVRTGTVSDFFGMALYEYEKWLHAK